MKVFNLTDVGTPLLQQHQMVDHTFAVGEHLVGPGQSTGDMTEEELSVVRSGLQELTRIGAVALGDQVPETYRLAKERAATESSKEKAPAKVPEKEGDVSDKATPNALKSLKKSEE